MWITFLQNISFRIFIYLFRLVKDNISNRMGRHSRKNTSGKTQATQEKEKEKKQKFDNAKQTTVKNFKHSNKVDLSITKSEEHSVKENWDDVDSNDTDAESKQRNVINETQKNVHENDEITEEGTKPSRKKRKKAKQTNNLQDHEMEWEENKIPDEVQNIQLDTETNPTEERIELHSKKSRRKRKTKNNTQDDDRETKCQEIIIIDDIPSIKPDEESNSTEECNNLRSKKPRRKRKPKNNDQDDDREMRCQENNIPNDVPSTPSNNEKKPLEDWNEVHYNKSKKNRKPKNNDQDRDCEMEWQQNKTVDRSGNENKPSRDEKEHFKKNRDDSSNRRYNSREYSHRENQSRKKDRDDSSHRKDHSRKHDEYFSYQKDRSQKRETDSSTPRKNEPRQYGNYSKTDNFRDANSGNENSKKYSQYNFRSGQDCSEDSYYHQKKSHNYYDNRKQYESNKNYNDYHDNKGYNADYSKRRSENYENSFYKTEGQYEPPHRRQDRTQFSQTNCATSTEEYPYYDKKNNYQTQNFRQNRENNNYRGEKNTYGRAFNNANTSQTSNQFKKKSYKQPLFVPNAEYYEPTIREIEGDLFEASEEYALGHCVAEDLSMGAGIAVEFKKRFKGVNDLWNQNKRTGEVAILRRGQRFIFYIITKTRSTGKPTIDSLEKAIKSLKQCCLELNVKKLAIPRIGCGLDRLDWGEVKDILFKEFNSTGIEIVVYVL